MFRPFRPSFSGKTDERIEQKTNEISTILYSNIFHPFILTIFSQLFFTPFSWVYIRHHGNNRRNRFRDHFATYQPQHGKPLTARWQTMPQRAVSDPSG
jgi:hypothetical protein